MMKGTLCTIYLRRARKPTMELRDEPISAESPDDRATVGGILGNSCQSDGWELAPSGIRRSTAACGHKRLSAAKFSGDSNEQSVSSVPALPVHLLR